MRVLLTGAAGHIGSVLAQRLDDEHELRGLDLRPAPQSWTGQYVVGDCADPDVAHSAMAGMDAVIHLAGVPTETDLPTILHSHVESTAALLDAMVTHGTARMVYASSNHAVGMTPRADIPEDQSLATTVRPRPDTFYGVGKVAAEALLSLYADRHRISSVAMRIGSFLERPTSRRNLATWLSYDDCAAMVRAALTSDVDGFLPIYGISANTGGWWDLEPGRQIGYRPADDASRFLADLPTLPADAAEGARVGGPYATDDYTRRPFARGHTEESG
ncbi:MAG: NAD(P)-dependent oxidoreductase [Propionibacteriales bacterium]|nr:NAD(P)-dependent oxidoreductase [Propionibacteriales bacterium]